MMKILIVGLGSIGRRHFNILNTFNDIELAALRTKKGTLKDSPEIREFYSIEDALAFKPDGVIICNPTSLHVESSLPFLKQGAKVLIEKPISNSSNGLEKLEPFAPLLKVAYCLRYLDIYEFLKQEFLNNVPFKISFKRSFYLPLWHPSSDYRQEYVAKKELGGGVLRTLSHEIDLAISWLGKPESVIGVSDKIGFLEIDTDDFAFFSLKMINGTRVNFELDLYSPNNVNEGEAITNTGKYMWDMNGASFKAFETKETKQIFEAPTDSLNKMYIKQLEDFRVFIKTGVSKACDFSQGLESIKVIERLS